MNEFSAASTLAQKVLNFILIILVLMGYNFMNHLPVLQLYHDASHTL